MSGIPPNSFKRRLAEGKPQLGFWLSLDSLAATEIAAGGGFEWILLDTEHTGIGLDRVEQHLLAARHGGDAEFIVRVPDIDPNRVKRLLDMGVRSFMFPWVQRIEDCRLAVAATRYPPAGIRGVSGIHRGNRWSRDRDYFAHAHEDICVIVQIETPQAVTAIPEFGTVEGLDAMFIGPNDLASNMGHLGNVGHPEVTSAISEALDRVRATGKAAGILNFDPAAAGRLLAQGFTFAAIGSDATALLRSFEPMIATTLGAAG